MIQNVIVETNVFWIQHEIKFVLFYGFVDKIYSFHCYKIYQNQNELD